MNANKAKEVLSQVSKHMQEKEVSFMFAAAKNRMFEAMLMANNPVEIEKARQECIDAFAAYLDKCIEINEKLVKLHDSIE